MKNRALTCAFMSRLIRLITFWHSCFHSKNFRALRITMSRLSCVQNCLCPDYRAFKIAFVQTIVRSKLHMSRLSCVQNCICPDYRAFIFFSRPCNFERTTPPCAFISVWTYRLSVWDLNLGSFVNFLRTNKRYCLLLIAFNSIRIIYFSYIQGGLI